MDLAQHLILKRAAKAATAAPRRIARTPTHGYEPTREAAMAAFARS